MSFHVPERYRFIQPGHTLHSTAAFGNNGAFLVPLRRSQRVRVIASQGMGWEHVSVSRADRCPTWEEMCQVKAIFWDSADVVMQLHPAEQDYVNDHPFCLHLWRPMEGEIPCPPSWMVGLGRKFEGASCG